MGTAGSGSGPRKRTGRKTGHRASGRLREHWIHLKTSNPIESTFATVRQRTKVTKGPDTRAAGLAMAFKLIPSAQARWRAVNALTSWPSSAPAPASRRANSSNDPTKQDVIS
jgi:transposase-like protein